MMNEASAAFLASHGSVAHLVHILVSKQVVIKLLLSIFMLLLLLLR
jgi:hypothetical protein